jgi:hypothetical protein
MPAVTETIPDIGYAESTTGDVCGIGIRCPKCEWKPRKRDRWQCQCGHRWNTFDTGGVCPACLRQWSDTQCLQCHQWSPHSDWYAQD